eukprot:g18420.t1
MTYVDRETDHELSWRVAFESQSRTKSLSVVAAERRQELAQACGCNLELRRVRIEWRAAQCSRTWRTKASSRRV